MSTDSEQGPVMTVDGVVFQVVDNQLMVLLIRRAYEPFKGEWALPGAYIYAGETTLQALNRVLTTKAGVSNEDLALVEQLYTFDSVARDPRGPTISLSYMGLGKNLVPRESPTVQDPQFHAVNNLPPLAYDHQEIVAYAHERLKSKLGYTNAAFALLPPQFTLTELQSIYEAVLMRPLDKRNFRKKFLSLDLIVETDDMKKDGAHRPARLYAFRQSTLQVLARSFD